MFVLGVSRVLVPRARLSIDPQISHGSQTIAALHILLLQLHDVFLFYDL